jgi:hypothetical protein
MKQTSTGDGRHPYLKGWRFWKTNQFWNSGSVTPSGVEYFNNSLEDMRLKEKQLTKLSGGK